MLTENLAMTTYIGFEYQGTKMAEMFTSLSDEEKNEVRVLVGELITDYWIEAGSPELPEDEGDEYD